MSGNKQLNNSVEGDKMSNGLGSARRSSVDMISSAGRSPEVEALANQHAKSCSPSTPSSSPRTFNYTCDTVKQSCSAPTVNNFYVINNYNIYQNPGQYNVRMLLRGQGIPSSGVTMNESVTVKEPASGEPQPGPAATTPPTPRPSSSSPK